MDAPTQVDDYTLGPLLEDGLTGPTYVATAHGAHGRRLALKLCRGGHAGLEPWAELLVADLDPRLVRYQAVGGAGPGWSGYLVSDLVPSLGTGQALEREPLERRIELAAEVAGAVAVLHAQRPPLIHGHIRPEALVLRRSRSGRLAPLLVEAGVRPLFEPAYYEDPAQGSRLYPYLAPEALISFRTGDGIPTDPAVDVYGAAALAVRLIAGAAPFTRAGEMPPPGELLRLKERDRFFLAAVLEPGARLDLERVNQALGQALSPDPGLRPAALALADALAGSLQVTAGSGA